MGKNSHIEWTHHTFNPWWGCAKVSQCIKILYEGSIEEKALTSVVTRTLQTSFVAEI